MPSHGPTHYLHGLGRHPCHSDYVLAWERVANEAKPEAVVFTDSFGVASPHAIFHAISELKKRLPGVRVEFHVHNEFGMAMGSVVAAAYAGVDGIHASINALGERTGNVATEEVAAGLGLLLGIDTGVDLAKIGKVCSMVEGITGIPTWRNKPVTGTRLFWLESGVVVDAKAKMEPNGLIPAMCPYMPEVVGHSPIEVVMGGSSGKASVKYFLDERGIKCTDAQVDEILEKAKTVGRDARRVLEPQEVTPSSARRSASEARKGTRITQQTMSSPPCRRGRRCRRVGRRERDCVRRRPRA